MTIIDRLLSLFVVPGRECLRNLLVPELADLRQQLDQARRLAGEAQARYRRAEEMARGFMADGVAERWHAMHLERDQLRARVAELEAESEERRQSWAESHARATKEQDRADALAVRVKELEAERAKMIEGGPLAEPRAKQDPSVPSLGETAEAARLRGIKVPAHVPDRARWKTDTTWFWYVEKQA
jgi:hypothetical protein